MFGSVRFFLPFALTFFLGPFAPFNASAEPPKQEGKKYALLVGCTQYELDAISNLDGPVNDVALWGELLTNPKGFAFPPGNIRKLAGWPDDDKARPTYANIVAGFEDLVAKSGPNVQIFVLLSGHGVQIPIPESQTDPLDPKNPEPDGMDEVFLPADVKSWDRTGSKRLENAIVDDQVGEWLDKMRDKGASVWIVFDCCHAGGMTRGPDAEERNRSVDPERLGIPPEAIASAAKRAREAVEKAANGGTASTVLLTAKPSPMKVKPDPSARGKLVAFYGCQSFEPAPELSRPAGAASVPQNKYGLLSYTLAQALQERKSPLTYRELAQIVLARYKAERSSLAPTPFAEGDVNLEVLGLTVWPNRPDILLRRGENKLTIDAGELRGLTPGSVLTVYPPAGDARGEKVSLGYVRVESATPLTAVVTLSDDAGKPVGGSANLPDLARCAILSQDLGDMRVKVALLPADKLRPVLDRMDARIRAMVQVVPEAQAAWILRLVTPQEAAEVFLLKDVKNDRVLLFQNEDGGLNDAARKQANERMKASGKPNLRKIYGGYPAGEVKTLVADLDRDLQKVFKVQGLWRIAGGLGGNEDLTPQHGLQFDVFRMKDEADTKGEALQTPSVAAGQILKFQITNNGAGPLWYAALYCDADFKIEIYAKGQIPPGKTPFLPKARVDEGTVGTEGMIVLALPVAVSNEEPNFSFLEQETLGTAEDATKSRGASDAPKTPFGQLMAAAAFNNGTRSASKIVPTTPAIRSINWTVLPTAKLPSKK